MHGQLVQCDGWMSQEIQSEPKFIDLPVRQIRHIPIF